MSTDKDTVETVEKLLAERRKIAGWLDGLQARQSSTPPTVYQRVYDDYTAKLQKVQGKLDTASDAVQVAAADAAAKLTDKEEQLAAKRDERAEAELRAAVGEFSEREWDKRRTRLDEELAATTGERDTLRDELARLRSVLDEVAAKHGTEESSPLAAADAADPTLAAVSSALEPPAHVIDPAVDAPIATLDVAPTSSAEDSAEGSTDPSFVVTGEADAAAPSPSVAGDAELPADEVAAPEVSSANEAASEAVDEAIDEAADAAAGSAMLTEPVRAPVIPIHEQSVIAPVEPAQSLAPSFDELEFLKSVVGRTTPAKGAPFRRTPPQPMPAIIEDRTEKAAPAGDARSYTVPEPPMPFPDPVPEPRVSQEMTPPRESFFGRPTPRTSEAVKSLRCQECGTLNYPTEWYCERCGGELAAL